MSLTIQRIEFCNFRNYDHLVLENLGFTTIFVGENAVGKTNIVEGIQLMTAIESFRHPQIKHLMKDESDQTSVSVLLKDSSRCLDLELLLFEGKRRYLLNGKPRKGNELKALCPAVMFNPDDLNLVKGPNGPRRDALDSLISQLSANHQVICKDYANVIKHKNALLKDEAPDDLIESINEMLITVGAQLLAYRLSLFKKLKVSLSSIYSTIVNARESLTCAYQPSWCEEENPFHLTRDDIKRLLSQALDDVFEEEKQRHRCMVGPHADGIQFSINDKDARDFASQGQQRSVVLAYKLSEVALIKDILGQQPILLLDDVMSELDEKRRNTLVQFIEDDMQVFITTTNLAYFSNETLEKADVIHLPID